MSQRTMTEKLGLKPGMRALILNAPSGYINTLGQLPAEVMVEETPTEGTQYDFVQAFVYSKADADRLASNAVAALKPNGLLWLAYPKKTGSIKTDITRDVGWETIVGMGWGGVTQIAIDKTWSALRFRPEAHVERKGKTHLPPQR